MSCNTLTITSRPQTSPTSITPFFTTFVIPITQTPVLSAPAASARWIGAGPRSAGRREGWTFSACEDVKRASKLAGRMRPKDAVMRTLLGCGGSEGEVLKGVGGWTHEG